MPLYRCTRCEKLNWKRFYIVHRVVTKVLSPMKMAVSHSIKWLNHHFNHGPTLLFHLQVEVSWCFVSWTCYYGASQPIECPAAILRRESGVACLSRRMVVSGLRGCGFTSRPYQKCSRARNWTPSCFWYCVISTWMRKQRQGLWVLTVEKRHPNESPFRKGDMMKMWPAKHLCDNTVLKLLRLMYCIYLCYAIAMITYCLFSFFPKNSCSRMERKVAEQCNYVFQLDCYQNCVLVQL